MQRSIWSITYSEAEEMRNTEHYHHLLPMDENGESGSK